MKLHNIQHSEWFINQKRIPDKDSVDHKAFFDLQKELCMNGCMMNGVYIIHFCTGT